MSFFNKLIKPSSVKRFTNINEIGQGSYGKVFKSFDFKLNTNVALKVFNSKNYVFYSQEIKALNLIKEKNPDEKFNCVKILDVGFYKNNPCIVMESLGDNLYTVITQNNRKLPIEKVTKLLKTF